MKLSITAMGGEAYEVEADPSATVRELQRQQDWSRSTRQRRLQRHWLLGEDFLNPSSTLNDLMVERGLLDGAVITEISMKKLFILTASSDHTAKLWNLSGSCTGTFAGHADHVTSVMMNADCTMMLTASHDRSAKLWDIETGACLHTLRGHHDYVVSAVFSKCNNYVLTAFRDRTVMVWSVATGASLQTFSAQKLADYVLSAVFSAREPNDALVLTASRDDYIVKLWTARRGTCIQTFVGHRYFLSSGAVSPDCAMVLTASQDRTARLWITESGLCIRTFKDHMSTVRSASFSMDGNFALTASHDRTAKVWSIETGECTQTFTGHADGLTSAVFCPDGDSVLTGSRDSTAKLWNIESGECSQTFSGHTDQVISASFSPDDDDDESSAVTSAGVLFGGSETSAHNTADWAATAAAVTAQGPIPQRNRLMHRLPSFITGRMSRQIS